MKIRNGFVSNSSSSSFIVSVENTDEAFVIIRVPVKSMVRHEAQTIEDLHEGINERYFCTFEKFKQDYGEDTYNDMVAEIDSGKKVLFCIAVDDGAYTEAVICHDGFKEDETEGISKIILESVE